MAEPNYYEYVSLVSGDGSDNATSTIDCSWSGFRWLFRGAARVGTAQSKYRNASLIFDGALACIAVGQTAGNGIADNVVSLCNFTADYLFEAWVWPTDFAQPRVIFGSRLSTGAEGPKLYFNTSAQLLFADSGQVRITGATSATPGAWHHVRVARVGGMLRLWLNGMQEGATVANTIALGLTDLLIGSAFSTATQTGAEKFKGFIAEIKIARGPVVPTINFTPPGPIDTTKPVTTASALFPIKRIAGFEAPTVSCKGFTTGLTFLFDLLNGGNYKVEGSVVTGPPDVPQIRRVRLHRKIDGMPVREVWSLPNGSYSFKYIAGQMYYVTAFDHMGQFNAAIKDSIAPEPML